MHDRPTGEESYYGHNHISIAPHESHPNCPDALSCLPDTEGRPQHTLPVILRCAILGSPKRRLTIRDIYAAMEKKYPYYKTAGPAWKQSVRHHLSLNRLFERQPRPATDPGFGSYWTVNLNAPPGTKRPRKRGRANKEAANLSPVAVDSPSTPVGSASTTPVPPPRTPTPPLKVQEKTPEVHDYHSPVVQSPVSAPAPVHKPSPAPTPAPVSAPAHPPPPAPAPGPPVAPPIATLRPVDSTSFSQVPTLRSAEYYDDDDDEMDWDDEVGHRMSDDEYPSAEETPYKFDPRASSSSSSHPHPHSHPHSHLLSHPPPHPHAVQGQPSARPALYGAFSGYANGSYRSPENQDPVIERLKMEMAGLRRQSTDAVNASLRMSSQLSDAQAEAAKARAALKVTESRLEEEIRRRREAEHIAEDEARLRLAAEDALRAYQLQRRPPGYSTSRP